MAKEKKIPEKATKWILTINNPQEHGLDHETLKQKFDELGLTYWCMCDEKGSQYHTHAYIERKGSCMRFEQLKKKFPSAHFDEVKGTAQENRDYIRKDGKWKGTAKEETNIAETFEESGECPVSVQGKRSDREILMQMLEDDMSTADILRADANYIYHIADIEKAREVLRDDKYRKVMRDIKVTYIWGETGTGKTRSVMDKYGYSSVYRVTNYDHPFDGYHGEDVIVFEEFRSSLKCSDMLMYLDIYPCRLPARFNDKTACFTKVYLCSNIPLDKQYTNIQREEPETFKAFMRRIHSSLHYESGKEPTEEEINKHGFVSCDEPLENIFKGEQKKCGK